MDRDSGFRSWFQRAIQISPDVRQNNHEENDESLEGSLVNDRFNTEFEGARPKSRVRGLAPMEVNHWSLLQKDNVRFWDCLAMLRSDPGLSCHSAIYLVTQSPDTEYFPDDLRSSYADYIKGEDELQIEVLRLLVENRKLHAVLWVLSDNPHFRVDSVVAAIFRLNETQFGEKFHFVYQPGCFSGKSPVLGPTPTKGADPGSTSVITHTKRCRSSTPVRTCRPLRHVSERLCHSVNRGSGYRRSKNTSSNRSSRCSLINKYEPPRKRRSDWMKSALLTGLDNKSANNPVSKTWESDNYFDSHEDDDVHDDNDDDDGNEDGYTLHEQFDNGDEEEEGKEEENGGDDRPNAANNDIDYGRYRKSDDSAAKSMFEYPQSRRKAARPEKNQTRKQTHSSLSYSEKAAEWGAGSHYSNNNNNSLHQYIDMRFEQGDGELGSFSKMRERSDSSHRASKYIFSGLSFEQKNSITSSANTSFRTPTINSLITQDLKSSHLNKIRHRSTYHGPASSVQFKIFPTSRKKPMITYSDTPRQNINASAPYALQSDDGPADFILRQKQYMQSMAKTQTKHDIRVCLKPKKRSLWQNVSPKDNRCEPEMRKTSYDGTFGKTNKKLDNMSYKRATRLKSSSKERSMTNHKVGKAENKPALSEIQVTGVKMERKSDSEKESETLHETTQPVAVYQKHVPNWVFNRDRYECMKDTLRKMGARRQYTKPLLTYINRVSSGKTHTPW